MTLSENDAAAIVKTLTSQPSQEELNRALRQFEPSSSLATPATASVVFAIVNTTVPEVWRSLHSDTGESNRAIQLTVSCLSSVSGVNALLARLDQVHTRVQHLSSGNEKSHLEDIQEILMLILGNAKFNPSRILGMYSQSSLGAKMLLNEYMSLVGGSKILNVASKTAMDLDDDKRNWISDGKKYSKWLGECLATAMKVHNEAPDISKLFGKALNIGYPYAVVEGLLPNVLSNLPLLAKTLNRLRRTSLVIFTKQLFKYLSTQYFNYTVSRDNARWWDADRSRVGAVAGVLYDLYKLDKLPETLIDMVRSGSGLDNLPIQRACGLAAAKLGAEWLNPVLDLILASWGDKFFISHTPVMAQETRTEMLLLLMAYTNTSRLREISSSTIYNEGLSSRLSASVDRVRFLGMIVGESISRKIDPEERRLKFKVPETEGVTGEAWRSLIDIDDEIYPLKDLRGGIVEETDEKSVIESESITTRKAVVDEVDGLDDDLPTYPVPESDAEDSDDDPTLVSREKTPNPLYIRDLMKYLQADDFNKVNVGLKSAPNLIRQKATFGTELSDLAVDLARVLVGLQDTYDMEQFQEMRQAALIALVASASETVVPYLINIYFTGDISIQQRCILLSAFGIGARELAGLEKQEYSPQQLLPPMLHRQYISPMDYISRQLEAEMIEPIRETAVAKTSGPQILQVRRFSSTPTGRRKVKTTVNPLSKLAGRVFIFPLLGRWWIHQQDYDGRGVHLESILLTTFIRTIGIILFASAPSALDLREMTKEYWDLLLSLRSMSTDSSVMEAILFGLLVILEITDPRHAAENFPKHVIETQSWTAGSVQFIFPLIVDLFQRMDEGKTKMLVGAVLLKIKEIVTKHERLLLGDIISLGSISSAPMGLNLR